MKYQYLITVEVEDTNAAAVSQHVQDAIEHWGGHCEPNDPFFPPHVSVEVQDVMTPERR